MVELLQAFFRGDYMPHGHCYLWQPGILWSNVISDTLIAVAYFSIPIALVRIVKQRKDLQFGGLFLLFALFIALCGITHLFSVVTVWHGQYGIHGMLKMMTAAISLITVFLLYRNLGQIISLPDLASARAALSEAADEKLKRMQLEIERKNEAIFKFATELFPTGLLVVDNKRTICMANNALKNMFGYQESELIGKNLSTLLPPDQSAHHDILVKNYMANPSQGHAMAAGRIVRGITKQQKEVSVEISLSVHEFEGVQHTFASVVDVAEVLSEKNLAGELSNRMRRAIEASNDGIWEWNIQTDQVWYSPQLLRMIGRDTHEPAKYSLWYEHIHPDDRAMVESTIEKHFANNERYDLVYRGIAESKQYEWFNARGDTLFDDAGQPLLMSGTLKNINQLKQLEAELNEQTRFLNEVLEKSLCAVYLFDFNTQSVTYVNPAFEQITGYSLADVQQTSSDSDLNKVIHPKDLECFQHHVNMVKNSDPLTEFDLEYRMLHKNGNPVWCYTRSSIYSKGSDGTAKEMLGTFFDITTLKDREDHIRLLMEEYSTTFEQAAVGIAHIDAEGRFIKVNQKLCQILGYSEPQMLLKTFADIIHEDDRSFSMQKLNELVGGDCSQFTAEKRYICASGNVIWMHITVSAVREYSGGVRHFVTVLEDITQRKKIELQLADSNSALERFAYSASHDLQEPLRKISAFAGLLESRLKDKLDDPDARFQLDRISSSAKRMGQMIQSLLQLSRYTRKSLDKEHCMLSEVVDQVKEDASASIARHNATVEVVSDIELYVEVNGFQQVVRNLVSNAMHYAKPGIKSHISITGYPAADGKVAISVKDNGPGFNTKFAEEIFEPFRRLVGVDKPGSGMGLAICRQIVQAHNGTIKALSEAGLGAEFIIELPSQSRES